MYKAIKDNKIIAISDTDSEFFCVVKDEVVEDTEHTTADYGLYYYEKDKSEYLLKADIPAPSREEQSAKREQAYIAETDPIQTHIDRLKDGEQTAEIVAEIEALRVERDEKIAAIKERYPYPEGE